MSKKIFTFMFIIAIAFPCILPAEEKASSAKIDEQVYTDVLAQMIRLQGVNRKKYKVSNPNPYENSTIEGRVAANKFAEAMKKGRKNIFAKYGVSEAAFEQYSDKLDEASSDPKGAERRQKLFDRAAAKAKALGN